MTAVFPSRARPMISRDEAIQTIEAVLNEAAKRVTKPLRFDAVAVFRAESIAAYDVNPERFPTTAILAKYVKFITAAKPSSETQALADPLATLKRNRMPKRPKKPRLEES